MRYSKNNLKLGGEMGRGGLKSHKKQEKSSYFTQNGRRKREQVTDVKTSKTKSKSFFAA